MQCQLQTFTPSKLTITHTEILTCTVIVSYNGIAVKRPKSLKEKTIIPRGMIGTWTTTISKEMGRNEEKVQSRSLQEGGLGVLSS